MSGASKSESMTRGQELLALLREHPAGLPHKEVREQLNLNHKRLYFLVNELRRQTTIKSWQEPGQKGGVWFLGLNEFDLADPKVQPRHVTPSLPPVSSRAQEAYKVVRQLQHRDARHLAHAAGYSYGYAAEMMAELQQAGAL